MRGVGGRRAAVLAAVFAGSFVALLNMSVATVALPRMAADLGTDAAGLRWVLDAYTLCLSALMLSGGVLGDRYGRRRVFVGAVGAFTLGSVLCAAASSPAALVGGRVVQGAAAAVIVPGSMSLLAQAYPDAAARARVIGWWSVTASVSVGAGPLLGGLLVDASGGWPAVFWVVVPVGVAVVALGAWALPESSDPSHAALDLPGQVLGVAWLGALSYGLVEGGHRGWSSAGVVAALAVAAVALAAFVAVELRAERPMLPIRLLGRAPFAAANAGALLLGLGAYGMFFYLSPYLQHVRGYSATGAGLRMVPMAVGMSLLGALAGRLTARFGPYGPMGGAFGLMAAALLGMGALLDADVPYGVVAVLLLALGAGIGVVLPPLNASALAAVPRERSGAAAATVNAVRQTGTSLGIAVLGAVLAARSGGAESGDAFVTGLRTIAVVAGAISLAGAAVVLLARRAIARRSPASPLSSPPPLPPAHPARPARPAQSARRRSGG
ncbi:MFS transporter [Actinomadura yumaensis]|uniref:MFS transporter n=2 Tax=Actinomadura TaxID=1988 RepID=A0ABW2CHP0_9ACTN